MYRKLYIYHVSYDIYVLYHSCRVGFRSEFLIVLNGFEDLRTLLGVFRPIECDFCRGYCKCSTFVGMLYGYSCDCDNGDTLNTFV